MAYFWFACLCILAHRLSKAGTRITKIEDDLKTATQKKENLENRIKSVEKKASDKIVQTEQRALSLELLEKKAQEKLEIAKKLEQTGKRLKIEAETTAIKTKEENQRIVAAIDEIVNLWINDSFKSISDRLTFENFATQRSRLEKVFLTCKNLGLNFNPNEEDSFFKNLEVLWEHEVDIQRAKDEQARIREIMREEQRAEKIRQTELKKIEQETKEIEKKRSENDERLKILQELEKLKQLTVEQQLELDQASAEHIDLLSQLQERERRKSMAELTKAGHIYVISNIGSFGQGIYKIGMTRRLIPEDRVKELGDASVPFPFDIHLMVATENAPTLESRLHEELWGKRINLVNDRKEFFKANIDEIKTLVDKHGGELKYEFRPEASASQWLESESRRAQGKTGTYDTSVEIIDEDDGEDAA